MPIVKLKNGKEKCINDVIDLREIIFEELGTDAEDEFIKIIEKMEGLAETVECLEEDMKFYEEEKEQLNDCNNQLQNKINDLEQSLNYVKETIDSLKIEYKRNDDENRKLLSAIRNLENSIEL